MNKLNKCAPDLYEAAKMLRTLMTEYDKDFSMETKSIHVDLLANEMITKFKQALDNIEKDETDEEGDVLERIRGA